MPRTADGKPNFAAPAPRSSDGTLDLSGIWTSVRPDIPRDDNPVGPNLKLIFDSLKNQILYFQVLTGADSV